MPQKTIDRPSIVYKVHTGYLYSKYPKSYLLKMNKLQLWLAAGGYAVSNLKNTAKSKNGTSRKAVSPAISIINEYASRMFIHWHAGCNVGDSERLKASRSKTGEEIMRNLRNYFTALTLAVVLTMSVTAANAGIIVAGFADETKDPPCTETSTVDTFTIGLKGIIVAGFTGIIVAGFTDPTETCGIIVAG